MATERTTLADIRAVAKAADGIRMGDWTTGDPNNPLPEPLQEMADDIAKWFNPNQKWHLVDVRTGFINSKRIEESSVVKVGPHEGEVHRQFKTKIEEPDKFTPIFHFDAKNPPLRSSGIVRRRAELDFPQVFAPKFRDRVGVWRKGSANVFPDHIGSVYLLAQALKEPSSPYYLVGATVTVNRRGVSEHTWIFEEERKTKPPLEPATSLVVMVLMRDLVDYTRLEVNRLRRVQRQLDRKFPPLQPLQEPTQGAQETA